MKPLFQICVMTQMIVVITIIGSCTASAGRDPCDSLTNEKMRSKCYKAELARAEGKLKQVFKRIYARLNTAARKEFRKDSELWTYHKDYICGYQTSLETGKDSLKSSSYYSCLNEKVRERTGYIEKAFGGKDVRKGLAGTYNDGFGGSLILRKKGRSSYSFQIDVVRGPTAHSGAIDGVILIQNNEARYLNKRDCDDADLPCCRLSFIFHDRAIAIKEERCEAFHGARAYFDGTYRKIK